MINDLGGAALRYSFAINYALEATKLIYSRVMSGFNSNAETHRIPIGTSIDCVKGRAIRIIDCYDASAKMVRFRSCQICLK